MKKWVAAALIVFVSTMGYASPDWVDRELKDAAQQLDDRHYGTAFEISHNLLLIHRASPLDRDAADQARLLLSRAGKWVKASNPRVFSEEFLARAKRLGFVQAGIAWMPTEAKTKLTAEATARMEKLGHANMCADCKGGCVVPCPNCLFGKVKCMACMGTGQAAGGGAIVRANCPVCNGQGKSTCTFCGGCGIIACPKCNGSGLGE